ncbi:MAG TPA: long-chain fatty acid--CoA ligase [Sulfurovum sp.]|nr:long-chain fatty acid--CoA ligase [Sulfurovum sp.]
MKKEIMHFGDVYKHFQTIEHKDNFLHVKEKNDWITTSKKTFLRDIRYLTLAFNDLNWKDKQVAIVIASSPTWLMLDYALMLSGAISVPLFTNVSSKNLLFEFDDSGIHTAFVETQEQEKRIHQVHSSTEVIYIQKNQSGQKTLEDFLLHGKYIDTDNPKLFDTILTMIDENDLATIVYISGTSGTPKGVELSHGNLISQIHATAENYKFDKTSDVAFSFLPLAHIFERMVMHFYLSQELEVYFADDVKNVGVLLKEVNPTVMTVVPRLLEKVFFKMKVKAMDGNVLKKALVILAFYGATTKDIASHNLLDTLLDKLVYRKLRAALGSRMRMMISGGAALSDDLYRFYPNIGIPLYQGYGQTETSPVIASNTPRDNKVGTCGKAFPYVNVKVSEDGELLVKGPNVMRGYHNNSEATAKAIDSDGWLHTGDLASIDDEGFVKYYWAYKRHV